MWEAFVGAKSKRRRSYNANDKERGSLFSTPLLLSSSLSLSPSLIVGLFYALARPLVSLHMNMGALCCVFVLNYVYSGASCPSNGKSFSATPKVPT
jgi:hypothetical protein